MNGSLRTSLLKHERLDHSPFDKLRVNGVLVLIEDKKGEYSPPMSIQ
jgi:hypothetical protein